MKELEVPLSMIEVARTKAAELGKLHNSILKGKGNIAGFIGEQIALHFLGGTWENTYEYDIILPDGKRIDVKTKQTSVKPRPDYECSVTNYNTKQKCDAYAFVRLKNDLTVGWYLGCLDKEKYLEKATFMRKGDVDPGNTYMFKADCYNLAIKELEY
jgi:hypothetical protein